MKSRSWELVLRMLRSNDDVLACLSKDDTLVWRSNERLLPCRINLSNVGLLVREAGGVFIDLFFLRPNSSNETPPVPLSDWVLETGAESLLPLSQEEKNRHEGEGSLYRPVCKM